MIDNCNNRMILSRLRATINRNELRGSLFTVEQDKGRWKFYGKGIALCKIAKITIVIYRNIATRRGSEIYVVADVFFFKCVDHVDPVLLG